MPLCLTVCDPMSLCRLCVPRCVCPARAPLCVALIVFATENFHRRAETKVERSVFEASVKNVLGRTEELPNYAARVRELAMLHEIAFRTVQRYCTRYVHR